MCIVQPVHSLETNDKYIESNVILFTFIRIVFSDFANKIVQIAC